eukprot:gene15195-17981_t
MKTSASSRVVTPTASTTPSLSGGSRLFATPKVDTSPIDFDNEREVQRQLDEIMSEFKMKESRDWSYRLKALVLLQRVVAGNAAEMKTFGAMLRVLSPSLIEQVTEARSTIVKEACAVVALLAQRMRSRFEQHAIPYLQALLKIVVVKVVVIAEAAHNAVRDIIANVPTRGFVALFLGAAGEHHNEVLRRRASEYLLLVLRRAIDEPNMVLVTSQAAIEETIAKLLVDGGADIRATARLAFWSYLELDEKRAMAMMYEFMPTTQKNIFAMVDTLPASQQELASKIHQSLLEEDNVQAQVGESTDLDFDMSDFKREVQSAPTTPRAKTPTSGRASGLKGKSGSSLADPTVRSKSSLGMSRRSLAPETTTTSKASSVSPNTSTNMSGRYSSIGSRISAPSSTSTTTTGRPSLSQTLKTSQAKAASITPIVKSPPASLTKANQYIDYSTDSYTFKVYSQSTNFYNHQDHNYAHPFKVYICSKYYQGNSNQGSSYSFTFSYKVKEWCN